jgi:hypothetical protein
MEGAMRGAMETSDMGNSDSPINIDLQLLYVFPDFIGRVL